MTSECHIRHGCAAEGCWKWEQAEIPAKFTMQVRRPTLHIPFCLVKRTIIKNNPQNQTVSPTTPLHQTLWKPMVLVRFPTGFHPFRCVRFKLRRGIRTSATIALAPQKQAFFGEISYWISCSTVDGTSSNIILKW